MQSSSAAGSSNIRQTTLEGAMAAPKAKARSRRSRSSAVQTTLTGNPEERFLGKRGGLPTTKARLQEMARAMGLDTDGKTVAKLRSAILVSMGRSTNEQEQQRAQTRADRSRSQRRERRETLRRSNQRRADNQAVEEITEK